MYSIAGATSQTSGSARKQTTLSVLDSVPEMKRRPTVGVDHQDRSSSRGVLASDRLGRDLLSPLGQVLGVVNDLSDDATSSEVVLHVPSDLELQRKRTSRAGSETESHTGKEGSHLEVVEALVERLPSELSNLVVTVPEPSDTV
jgi:hypothetical protein